MAQPSILAVVSGPDTWQGISVRWGLPRWILPAVSELLGAAPTAADIAAVAASHILVAGAWWDRFETDADRIRHRTGARDLICETDIDQQAEAEHLVLLDPGSLHIEVRERQPCPQHPDWIRPGQLRDPGVDPGVCGCGARWAFDEASARWRHLVHRNRACGCLCDGSFASKLTPRIRFPAGDARVGAAMAALQSRGGDPEEAVYAAWAAGPSTFATLATLAADTTGTLRADQLTAAARRLTS